MSTIYSALEEIATQYPAFPCLPSKRPATKHGFKDAVNGAEEAKALFRRHPEGALIGVPTGAISSLIVIDIDPRHGGREWYDENADRLGETRIHSTMSGGLHILFAHPGGEPIRNSASRIAPGVDIRGDGGYVIFPPSTGYRVEHDVEPAPIPAWLLSLLRRIPEPPPATDYRPPRFTEGGSPYGLKALERACAAIGSAPDGAKHETLNREAYSIGGLVGAGHLDEGYARSALAAALAHILPRCDDEQAARRTLGEAFRDGLARPRIVEDNPRPSYQSQWSSADGEDFGQGERGASSKAPDIFEALDIEAILALPPPRYLVEGFIVEGGVGGIYGPPGSLKSFVAMGMGLSIAYGRPWMGREVQPAGVLYVAGEGARGLARRIRAWKQHFGIETNKAPFRLISATVSLLEPAEVAKLVRTALWAAERDGIKIGLVVIDTVARAMAGGDENSAMDMGRFVAGCDTLRDAIGTAVLGVHHTGKDESRGARGSSAYLGAMDTLARISRADMAVTVTLEKQKDDEEGAPFELEAHKVEFIEDGKPQTSLVLTLGGEPVQEVKPKRYPETFRILMRAVDIAMERAERIRPTVDSFDVMAVELDDLREIYYGLRGDEVEYEAKKKGFQRAIKGAVDREILFVREYQGAQWVWQ